MQYANRLPWRALSVAKRFVNPALSSAAILRASVAEIAVAFVRMELHKHAEISRNQDILHVSPLRGPPRFRALASCHLITYNAAPRKRLNSSSYTSSSSTHNIAKCEVEKTLEQVLCLLFFSSHFQLRKRKEMGGHWHDSTAGTQNQGNHIGDRSCVRQSKLYRQYVSSSLFCTFL